MSSPPRGLARRTSSVTREGSGNRRTSGAGSGLPVPNSSLRASRLASTQPSYDFLTGGYAGNAAATPVKPLGQSFRQSTAVKPDIGNEDLRAQIKTLQYEVESLKHDRDVTSLRHSNELRDAQAKAEEVFRKARAEDSARQVPLHKYDALNRSLKEAQDAIVNQKTALEKKLRGAQEAERAAREEAEEAQNDLASMDRQHKHTLHETESRLSKLTQTANDLRNDLDSKSNTLKATQDRLSQREAEAGKLESEILRFKAQTGDSETLGVIKRELSEQVAHIRQLEKTNHEQAEELKVFRKRSKAVEVVEEEKRVLESRLGLLDNTQKQLREAQLQRQILEDERRSWAAYLENEGSNMYETPEEVAKALARQQLENASLIQQKGELQAEQLEKDEMIKALESQRSSIQAELDSLKSSSTISATLAPGTTFPSTSTSSMPPAPSTTTTTDNRTRQRLEKQLSFAKKEIALMRDQLHSFDAEEQTYHPDSSTSPFSAAKSARIADLESLLDESRQELASLTAELSALEAKLNSSTTTTTMSTNQQPGLLSDSSSKSPLKRTHAAMEEGDVDPSSFPPPHPAAAAAAAAASPTAEEGEGQISGDRNEQVGQLTRKLRALQDQLRGLTSTNAVLTAEQTALQTQLRQLRDSARTRVLALRDNPTDAFEAVKMATVRALRTENAALLASLSSSSSSTSSSSATAVEGGSHDAHRHHDGGSGGHVGKEKTPTTTTKMVPLATITALRLELREREAEVREREKRILRLKQMFGAKTLEFREAVLSLLGWKMEFRADGKFVLSLSLGARNRKRRRKRRRGRDGGDDGGQQHSAMIDEDEEQEEEQEDEESFIFDGEKGTMKVSGGSESAFAQEVKPYFRRWVGREGWIPGLMASVLLGKVSPGEGDDEEDDGDGEGEDGDDGR